VLGAGVYLAKQLLDVGSAPQLELSDEKMESKMLEKPYDFVLHEYRERGAIAPTFGATRARVPWNPNMPPYYIARDCPYGPNDSPAMHAWLALANAQEHARLETALDFQCSRPQFARKRGQAIWQGFTEEITVKDADPRVQSRTTNHVGFQWLPPNPTDSDWNEAALIAKQLPPNPVLFTPDAFYYTAPGQEFRHRSGQAH